MFALLTPEHLSPSLIVLLILLSAVSSMITASCGAGGGLLLLAVLSMWLPPLAIIPVHGLIQLASNSGRAVMTLQHIHWPTIGWFAPGVVVGGIIGAVVLVQLPPPILQASIALFIFYLCWGPTLPAFAKSPSGILLFSTVTSFLTLFVGATGPLVSAFIKQLYGERFVVVATFAMAMVLQHCVKLFVFGLTGFNFVSWLPFILIMAGAGFVGTWVGLKLLGRLPDRHFHHGLNVILTLLAIRLLWQAWQALSQEWG